jgi:anti-sigma28 factor (negative regulator of flagellin synthesis)
MAKPPLPVADLTRRSDGGSRRCPNTNVKIDPARQPGDADPAERLETSREAERPDGADPERTTESRPAPRVDRVEVSTDARVLTVALKAASDAPDIRLAAVERAQEALRSGRIGQDTVRLAERMIDELVKGA